MLLLPTGHHRAKSMDVTSLQPPRDKHTMTYAVESTHSDSVLATGNSDIELSMTPEELDYLEHLHGAGASGGEDGAESDDDTDSDDEEEIQSTL